MSDVNERKEARTNPAPNPSEKRPEPNSLRHGYSLDPDLDIEPDAGATEEVGEPLVGEPEGGGDA